MCCACAMMAASSNLASGEAHLCCMPPAGFWSSCAIPSPVTASFAAVARLPAPFAAQPTAAFAFTAVPAWLDPSGCVHQQKSACRNRIERRRFIVPLLSPS